jgi:predicted ArsR family transcriptional regulator
MTVKSSHIRKSAAKGSQKREKTRDGIISLLKREGPQDAGVLAARLKVSAMAVRQHLYELQGQRLVSASEQKGAIGRPVKIWALEEAANDLFPDAHGDFTYDLIASVRETFGEEGMASLLRNRSEKQIIAYAKRMGDGTLKARLTRLAKLRSEEGYMAEVSQTDDGALLMVENHCPVCQAARACSGLCAEELHVFEGSLGEDVSVKRVDHILAGARRCAYRVTSQ